MFTGIIEELGEVKTLEKMADGIRFRIAAKVVLDDMNIGDSIAVNGVCLTATEIDDFTFVAEAVGETLEKTSIGHLAVGGRVNLERPMRVGDRFGGHFVQGHVNATGKVVTWEPRAENWLLEVAVPDELMRYVVPEGSITIEGISLTVAAIRDNVVGINIIPHTAQVTNLQFKNPGSLVNIEIDMMARYLEKILANNGHYLVNHGETQ